MGIVRRLVTLPLAPVEGVIWLARQLEQQAYDDLYGPSALRSELAEIDAAFEAGELSADERDLAEERLLIRLERLQENREVPNGY